LSKSRNPRDHEPLALSREKRSGDPMADTQAKDNAAPRTTVSASNRLSGWLYPALRIAFLIFAAWLIWYTAGHWDRWTGAARFETTDDAFVTGDVTPLSARVSGNITEMPVNDFQIVKKGDLLAVIDPSIYQAQFDLAEANLAAAQAALANLEIQRSVQQALVREAESTIEATEADVLRYQLEDKRQHDLLRTGIAGT
jgi:membrane fusion protein (multidrug efflux system)